MCPEASLIAVVPLPTCLRPVRCISCAARKTDPWMVSKPVPRMPELTTNDPWPRLIVEGTVNAAVPY